MYSDDSSRICGMIDRRGLLTRTVPACAAVCLGLNRMPGLAGPANTQTPQDLHKFDVKADMQLSPRQLSAIQNRTFFEFIKTLQEDLDRADVMRLLNANSEKLGRQLGQRQASSFPDTSFGSFVSQFRPPNYANAMTHEVVEDTDKTFGLAVKECIWVESVRAAGLDGDIGHAIVCNMDFYWPPAFNPAFIMERDKTLMQGDGICNHRYIDTA